MNTKGIKVLKELRVETDVILHQIKDETAIARELGYGRELALAYTALQKGRMYLGEIQHDMGAEYPYKGTNQAKDASGISLAVDKAQTPIPLLQGNNIEKLGKLRTTIDEITNEVIEIIFDTENYPPFTEKLKFKASCHASEAYRSLKESRMNLGMCMGVIKDNNTKTK